MQDVEQGEPQSQVLFRVTFLQCITLARQTLHHKSATYQQRHHEAARLPDLRRGGRLRGPPALPRGLPAGSAPESRPRPAPDDGGGTAPEETSVMPVVAVAVRGITPVKPLPSRRPAAAAVSGTTWDRSRPPGPIRQDGRGRPSRRWRTACSEPVPAGRPGAAGSGSSWSGMGRLCDVADEDAGGRHEPGPVGGCSGSPGVRGGPPGRLRHAFASAAPFSACCAPSPSAAPLLLVQWRVKRRSRVKGAQQMRTRTGPRSPPCTGPPPHSPLPPHWIRPSHRGRGRTGERRGPRLGKAADAHLPASAPRPSSSHSSTNPGEKGSTNGIHVRESRS